MTDAREALVALIRTTVLIFRPEAERLADAILAAGWTPPGEGGDAELRAEAERLRAGIAALDILGPDESRDPDAAPMSSEEVRWRPAPVVPDSADVRERALDAAYRVLNVCGRRSRLDEARWPEVPLVVDAVLAAVDQGVAAEAVEYAIDGAIPDDLPGYRQRYTERAARRVLALLRHGDADHPSADDEEADRDR